MTQRQVGAQWVQGPLRCEVRSEGGHVMTVDEPVSSGGTDLGPQPTDLFLASVASCFTLALVYAATKHGLEPTAIDVDVTGEYDGPQFATIEVAARVEGVDAEQLERLVTSAERVCYVTRTLRRPPEITVTVVRSE